MNKLRVLQAPLVRMGRFPSREVLAEMLSIDCASGLDILDSPLPAERCGIINKLALCCLVRFEEPGFDPMGVVNLLDHYAKYSPHEDMRRACIDALGLLGQKDLLEGMTFEIGSYPTSLYRDRMMRELFKAEGWPASNANSSLLD
jgi:hypothetical protein